MENRFYTLYFLSFFKDVPAERIFFYEKDCIYNYNLSVFQ